MKTHTHPSGIKITFESSSHRYADSLGRGPYTSITTIVKSLFPPFDPDGSILARCAAKEGVSPATLSQRWADASKSSCELGTRVHAVAESVLLGRDLIPPPPATSDRELRACAAAWSAATAIRQASAYVAPEQIIADPDSLTAGTMDLIAFNDDCIKILDWKTSKEIKAESKYGSRALPPFQHLHDCELVKYSIQLLAYEWILLNAGYFPPHTKIESFIAWIRPDNPDVQWLPTLPLQNEVNSIMRARRASFQKTQSDIQKSKLLDFDATAGANEIRNLWLI
jgi:hypothetical protein